MFGTRRAEYFYGIDRNYMMWTSVLPILVAAVTAYAASKILEVVREQQMQKSMNRVSQLGTVR
jgi:hypothetical protein